MTSTEDLRQYAQVLANAGHLRPEERQVVMERIDAAPYVAKRPPEPAFTPMPPPPQRDAKRSIRKATAWTLVVLAVLIGAGWAILSAYGLASLEASARIVILGADCSASGYSDANQIVVRNPKGDEVAFADLARDKESAGYCVYKGVVKISDDSEYFNVGSRSEIRAGIRMTRAEISKGIDLTIGECPSPPDLSDDVSVACSAWVLAGGPP